MSANALSADPRDKVFGVSSLLKPRFREFLPIDYSMDSAHVLGIAVVLLAAEACNLAILRHARLPNVLDCTNASSFGTEELHDYLALGQDFGDKSFLTQGFDSSFARGKIKYPPYRPWVLVKMVSNSTQTIQQVNDTAFKTPSSDIIQVSATYPPQQVLPRLRVCAHLVDILSELLSRPDEMWGYHSWNHAKMEDSIREIFQVPRVVQLDHFQHLHVKELSKVCKDHGQGT
jgi:hypothetical protein